MNPSARLSFLWAHGLRLHECHRAPFVLGWLLRKETCNFSKYFTVRLHLNNMALELSFSAQRNGPRLGNSITWNIPLSVWRGKTVCERLYPVSMPKDSWLPLPDQELTDWWHWGVIDSVRARVASGGHGSPKQATLGDKPGELHHSRHNTPLWPVLWPGMWTKAHK